MAAPIIHKTTVTSIAFAECVYAGIEIKVGAYKLHPVYRGRAHFFIFRKAEDGIRECCNAGVCWNPMQLFGGSGFSQALIHLLLEQICLMKGKSLVKSKSGSPAWHPKCSLCSMKVVWKETQRQRGTAELLESVRWMICNFPLTVWLHSVSQLEKQRQRGQQSPEGLNYSYHPLTHTNTLTVCYSHAKKYKEITKRMSVLFWRI